MRSVFVRPVCFNNHKRISSISFPYQIVKTYELIDIIRSKNTNEIFPKIIVINKLISTNFSISLFDIPKDIFANSELHTS